MTARLPYAPYEPAPLPPPLPDYRPPRRRGSAPATVLVSVLAAVVLVISAVVVGAATSSTVSGIGSLAAPGNGLPGSGQFPGGTPGLGPTGRTGNNPRGLRTASPAHQIGVVTVVSKLKYQPVPIESAGTGMILSGSGEVLTNNHVINGAGTIVVTDETTGRSYSASVVGTAPTRDVALLQLRNATGLRTAPLAESASALSLGDSVIGVGNAKGTGRLTQVSGKVTGLQQTITASDEGGGNSERLTGLIETNAAIVSGDSGGPLYDSAGQIIGMDTAASAQSTAHSGYAIPIENALSVVHAIQAGVETAAIHIGLPGFLGVGLAPHGTKVKSLLPGPAAGAGITEGSVITSVDGTPVHSGTALHNVFSAKGPGASVRIGWVDASGNTHSAVVVLATGPAD